QKLRRNPDVRSELQRSKLMAWRGAADRAQALRKNTSGVTMRDFVAWLSALAILGATMFGKGVFSGSWEGDDEPSHFLNAYLVWSYVSKALGANPLVYARDFYLHYPKISIGHWPPLYYALLSPFFFVLPPEPPPFLVINVIVAALPALLVIYLVRCA